MRTRPAARSFAQPRREGDTTPSPLSFVCTPFPQRPSCEESIVSSSMRCMSPPSGARLLLLFQGPRHGPKVAESFRDDATVALPQSRRLPPEARGRPGSLTRSRPPPTAHLLFKQPTAPSGTSEVPFRRQGVAVCTCIRAVGLGFPASLWLRCAKRPKPHHHGELGVPGLVIVVLRACVVATTRECDGRVGRSASPSPR